MLQNRIGAKTVKTKNVKQKDGENLKSVPTVCFPTKTLGGHSRRIRVMKGGAIKTLCSGPE